MYSKIKNTRKCIAKTSYSKNTLLQNGHKRGFTLIELLVVIAIISVIAGVGGDMFATVMRSYRKADLFALLEKSGSQVLTQVEQDIRSAIDVKVTNAAGEEGKGNDTVLTIYIPKNGAILEKTYKFEACDALTDTPGTVVFSNNGTDENLLIQETENLFKEKIYLKPMQIPGGVRLPFLQRVSDPAVGYDMVFVSFVVASGGTNPCENTGSTNNVTEVYLQTSTNLRGGLE